MANRKKNIGFNEKQWQAEEDARTMARYEEIMQSSSRKSAAMREAKKQALDLEKRASVMKKASGGKLK